MGTRTRPLLLAPGGPLVFPDAARADSEGLLAVGGDLRPERLLLAYDRGIFPWYSEGLPPMWWSPDPRALFEPGRLHVSRSMLRELKKQRFLVSFDRAFGRVLRECGREREGGTWLLPEMIDAYEKLHALGHAHSVEVWAGDALVGGLYGVRRGGLFAAESMFHRVTNASKVAVIAAVRSLFAAGIELFDVQFLTPHLESLGALEVSRAEYLARLHSVRDKFVTLAGLDPNAHLSP
jgi:leucyl/phenylalanyl-tRNA--protein transferase